MVVSAEVRWFYGGELPQATLDWFCYDELVSTPEERIDRYLLFPGCESVGMKVRKYDDKYNLEVKALRGGTETLQLPNGVTGRAECWVKWAYGEEPVASLVQTLLAQADGSIDVQKKRWLRKFSLDGGQPAPVYGRTDAIARSRPLILDPSVRSLWRRTASALPSLDGGDGVSYPTPAAGSLYNH